MMMRSIFRVTCSRGSHTRTLHQTILDTQSAHPNHGCLGSGTGGYLPPNLNLGIRPCRLPIPHTPKIYYSCSGLAQNHVTCFPHTMLRLKPNWTHLSLTAILHRLVGIRLCWIPTPMFYCLNVAGNCLLGPGQRSAHGQENVYSSI